MVLGRNNVQFRILYSSVSTFKKESKTTDIHYATIKRYKYIKNKVNPEGDMGYTKVQQA